ncbi:hypothetical protein Bbelb_113970 [Branchiostoma belcheri]|nr:hypothetical protein Bbelb_113970 [Branchiostoma belcheri]
MASVYLKRAPEAVKLILFCVLTPFFFVVSNLLRAAWFFPPLRRLILSRLEKTSEKVAPGVFKTPEEYHQLLYELTSFASWKGRISVWLKNLEAEVFEGGKAADFSLVRLDGSSCRLLQFARAARPLVITFGSNT